MWRNYGLGLIIGFLISLLFGFIFIPLLKKWKAGQTILGYVSEHKSKSGTPTMGGLFFIFASVLTYYIVNGFYGKTANVAIAFTVGYMLVGFLDDFIKIKLKRNLGLKAYQKIIFQVALSVIAGLFCYFNGITELILPFSYKTVDISWGVFVFVPLVFIATTNSVNLTDGLDGLAGNCSVVFLLFFVIIYGLQTFTGHGNILIESEYKTVSSFALCLVGGILGFLVFNTNKASVFMGDTGSMAIGGAVASVSIFTGNSLLIPILGIMFVLSSLSVVIQVISFKSRGKRVFLMAPFHHHLQQKGLSEGKISFIYSLITFFSGLILALFYLW